MEIALSRRDEYAEVTRNALIAAGREAFASVGYADAGIEAISRTARVTRGAFYHHYADKRALFDAVVTQLQAEAATRVARAAKREPVLALRLGVGIDAYLDACLEPEYARIVLRDGAAVLGDRRFQEIEEAYPLALLVATLETLKSRGELVFEDVGLLARLIDAMICKVAVMIADTPNASSLRRQARSVVDGVLSNFSSSVTRIDGMV